MANREVYLDHAAATPMSHRVVETMLLYFTERFYNPSAPYWPAVEVRQEYERAKAQIGKLIGVKSDQLIITAGATESINLALAGRKSILISGVEHPSVVKAAQASGQVKIAPVTSQGIVEVDGLTDLIDDQTELVSVCLASSDLGTIQPLRLIAETIKQKRLDRLQQGNQTPLLFHSDASQGLAFLDFNAARSGVDLLTISAAKLGGPKQVAALWVRPGVKLQPLITGGGQEMGLRSGTENVAGVIGFAAAVREITTGQGKMVAKLRDHFEQTLSAELPFVRFLGSRKKRLPNYSVFTTSNLEAERLIYRLEKRGVFVSTGAACAASRGQGSLALKSIGLTEAEQAASLRITLGVKLNQDDIDYAVKVMAEEIKLEKERVDAKSS